jgi:hypothetical protein
MIMKISFKKKKFMIDSLKIILFNLIKSHYFFILEFKMNISITHLIVLNSLKIYLFYFMIFLSLKKNLSIKKINL